MKPPELEVSNLSFHYPDGRMALKNISFRMQADEIVGLVGPNGAGKSTLLLHLNGILPGRSQYEHHHPFGSGHKHAHATHPRVSVAGLPVAPPHLSHVRRHVGLLFQDPDDQLFCPTVLDDVAFGPLNLGYARAAAHEIARRSLAAVGLEGFGDRLPHHLSQGEKRRVCLAAVLACEPTLLALDEPSGSLDPTGRRQFMTLLRDLPKAKIIATHDLELVLELCSRVILLDEGTIHADGPCREVLSDEPLLRRHGLELPLSIALAGARNADL